MYEALSQGLAYAKHSINVCCHFKSLTAFSGPTSPMKGSPLFSTAPLLGLQLTLVGASWIQQGTSLGPRAVSGPAMHGAIFLSLPLPCLWV